MPYKMPHVEAGMTVMWSPGGSIFTPGIVTKVGLNSIALSVLREGATSFVPKASVRHASDPGFRKLADPSKTGCWEYTDHDSLLAKLATTALGPKAAKGFCPALSHLIDAYTLPTTERDSSYSDDDPDVVGA